jgi:hypothetical protein
MNYRLSPSTIGLFLDCPRCFWLHINRGIKRPSGIFPSLPAGMDRILKEHFDSHRKGGTYPEELREISGHLFKNIEKLNEWRNNFRGLRFTDNETGATLMGVLDELFVTDDGRYAPLDFKTRGFPRKSDTHSHYQHQMDLYGFLLQKNDMDPAGFAILIFYHPVEVNKNHDVTFKPDTLSVPISPERGRVLFREAVECLINNPPDPREGCEFCRLLNTQSLEG